MGWSKWLGLKPGIWYQKKPKKQKMPEREKQRLNVQFGTSEEEFAELERKRLKGMAATGGKRQVDYKGGGLIGGNRPS